MLPQESHFRQFQVELPRSAARNYGNCIILSKDRSGEPSLVLGPHWYVFMLSFIATLVLLALLLFSLRRKLALPWWYSLILCATIYAFSYIRIGLSNPGFADPLPTVDRSILQNPRYCQLCRTIRSHYIYHCYDCDVCIEGYDHHCPWIGKCVGSKNLYSFYFFLFMIFGTLAVCLAATIASSPNS